jgi:hypothetical protein
MKAAINSVPNWVWSGMIAIIAFAAGFVTNYYISYRGNYLSALNVNYDQFDATTAEIRDSLKVFADIAGGERKKKPEDSTALQLRLLNAVGKVEDLSRRIDNSADFIKNYQTAAVKLKSASDEITGPANGKALVLAVNDYLLAEREVRNAVLREYNSFIWR